MVSIYKKLLFLIILSSFLSGCRDNVWNPDVAVLVNDEPIFLSEVDLVLEWGFHPVIGQSEKGGGGGVNIQQILDKLIDEKLILSEAKKNALFVSSAELDSSAALMSGAWFGSSPPPAELGELKEALRRQIILRKMTEKVIAENRVLSVQQWNDFWANWPKKQHPRYLVQILFAPPLDLPPPELDITQRGGLTKIAENMEKAGLPVIVSEPVWLLGDRLPPDVLEALQKASQGTQKPALAGPLRLNESWVLYDILEIDNEHDLEDELIAARDAFEAMVDEQTFQNWLKSIRAKATIKISPVFSN
ncbi:MAG: hypothetical protein ACRCTY_01600 [Candidatus Adiutrix sp.]